MQNNPLQAASPDRSAVVTASAGVGKTYLLVTRLVRLLLSGARPDAILAITFTRKAAAEMQSRLAERLFALAQLGEAELDGPLRAIGVEPTPEIRRDARNLYERLLRHPSGVRTTTFHAFCQEILRRFPLEADVPPGFDLLERSGATQATAWDALYAQATRDPEGELGQALETLFQHTQGADSTRTALTTFLSHRSDWWAFVGDQADPVAYACNKLRRDLGVDLNRDPLSDFLTETVLTELQDFAQLLSQQGNATAAGHAASIHTALQEGTPTAERFDKIWDVFFTEKNDPRSRKHTKALEKAVGVSGADRFLTFNQQMVDRLTDANAWRKLHAAYQVGHAWYSAGHQLLTHYQRIKQEQRMLDFSDLEWKAFQLLSQGENAQWVQFKLDQRIDHMLIDEFQDTNPTQWRLLQPLLSELASSDRRDRSVFIVGDVKQSIYGFRRADPRLLPQAASWLEANLNAQQFPMDTSRRSAAAIMELVNRTFGAGELAGHITNFHPHHTHREELWGHVELLPLLEQEPQADTASEAGLRNPLQRPRPDNADKRHYIEGQQVAEKINDLIHAPTLIGPTAKARPLRYGDIMILMRARSHAADFEQALREAHIPYMGANRGTLLATQEIQDMVALLATLNTPHDNLSLASVLRSPLFEASNEDLLQLAQASDSTSWSERLAAIAPQLEPGSSLARAQRLLAEWRQWIGRIPIHDLLDRVYDEGNVLARFYASFPPHLRHRARINLTRFLELALEVDSGRYPSIDRFLSRLDQMTEHADDAPDEAVPGDVDDAVRLMTIHGSKGLEAPVVFLVDATRSGRANNTYNALVDWPTDHDRPLHFRLILKKEDRDAQLDALLTAQEPRAATEDANLLYVAVTRAQQMLFVSGCTPTREEQLGWYGQLQAQWPADQTAITSGERPNRITAPPRPTETPWTADIALATRMNPRPAPTTAIITDSEWQGEHARERGIAVHRLLELLSATPPWSEDAALRQTASELHLAADATLLRACLAQAKAVLTHPTCAPLFDPRQFRYAYNEVPMLYSVGDQVQHGVIDRLVISAHEALVVDYKTHQGATTANAATLASAYLEQIQGYVSGVRRLHPKLHVRGLLLFTHGPHICPLTDTGNRNEQRQFEF